VRRRARVVDLRYLSAKRSSIPLCLSHLATLAGCPTHVKATFGLDSPGSWEYKSWTSTHRREGRGSMFTRSFRSTAVATLALFCLSLTGLVLASDSPSTEPKLTEEQERDFLLHAKVIKSKQSSKGVTSPWRLTLSDGTLTHDAIFQPVDERKNSMSFGTGRTELNFKDSYHFNIA